MWPYVVYRAMLGKMSCIKERHMYEFIKVSHVFISDIIYIYIYVYIYIIYIYIYMQTVFIL